MLLKADGTPVQPLRYVFGSGWVLVQHADGTQENLPLGQVWHPDGERAKADLLRIVRVAA